MPYHSLAVGRVAMPHLTRGPAALLLVCCHSAGVWPGGLQKEVRVAAPTRLDWQHAASAFGKDATRLPAGYDSSKQRYLLYVPKGHKPDQPAPLVLFISPGDGPAG